MSATGNDNKRTRIISIGGGKGGVGKSVVSSNLAVAMASQGVKTVLADLDLGTANQHLLLGVDHPKPGIEILLSRDNQDPRDGLTETGFANLSLLACTGASLGTANIRYQEKIKLIRKLRQLDADVVLIDVGAGVGYNALDFFELGAQRLVVTTPQVTAIHDAYAFLKGAALRTLHHHVGNTMDRNKLEDANRSDEGEKIVDILARLKQEDPQFAEQVFHVLENFGAYLVGNQVTDEQQIGIFTAVSKMVQDYIGISVPILGWLEHTKSVTDSVNQRRPLVLQGPSENQRTLMAMAETLLLEDVLMEEDLLLEIEIDGQEPNGHAANEAFLRPDELHIPSIKELKDRAQESNNNSYLGGPRARVYQPPPRKKRPPTAKRDPRRRRRITLPGMTMPGNKAAGES